MQIDLLRQDQAKVFYDSLPESPLKWVIGKCFVSLVKKMQTPDEIGTTSFDLKLFYDLIAELVSDKEHTISLLNGQNPDSWGV